MRIIIAGAGEVGKHVAKMLSFENQDIILIDADESRLKNLDSNYDLLTKVGSPTSIKDLREAGAKDADLFIAVTPHESVNITACMLAAKLGAKKTLSRIDNKEYLETENADFFKQIGVASLVYPEMLAANEIVNALAHGWIREYRTFGDNKLVLAGIKVRSNAPIANHPFNTGICDHNRFRIVAIMRHNKTIIPCGSDEIRSNDVVYVICPPHELDFVREQLDKTAFGISNVFIMGGSRIAINTVNRLPKHVKVKIFEPDRKKCYQLAELTPNALIINGDGHDIELLRSEGIESADAFLALTGDSESNILACLTAKQFGINKTIAEVENIDYINLAENLDIGTLINKKLIAASHIYQLTFDDDVADVTCLTYSDAEVVEFVVKPGDKITMSRVSELRLPANVNIGGIIRNGVGIIVKGNTVIQPGDHVVVFCLSTDVRKIAKFFN